MQALLCNPQTPKALKTKRADHIGVKSYLELTRVYSLFTQSSFSPRGVHFDGFAAEMFDMFDYGVLLQLPAGSVMYAL